MKKFFVTLLILIILGGAAFFVGWVQFSVPNGSYGVMSSKTHGVDPQLISAGKFRWVWYKLIPTNVSIEVFRIEPVRHTMHVQGILPSGNVYAAFAGNQADFNWNFDAEFSFALRPDSLVELVSENKILTQDELANFQQNLANEIESAIIRYISSPSNSDELETIMAGSGEALENRIAEQFPAIANFSCQIKNVQFPDFILYRQVRGLYEDFISAQRELTSSTLQQKAENRINSMLRIDELERYGELLNKYPILLQYLTKTADIGVQ